MTLREQIVTEIMSLVRQQPRRMEPKPTIEELEKLINSESTDEVHIEPDGNVTLTPTMTTVGAIADKVIGLFDAAVTLAKRQSPRFARRTRRWASCLTACTPLASMYQT